MPIYSVPPQAGQIRPVGTLETDSVHASTLVVAYAATVTLDLSAKNDFEIYLTGNIEIVLAGLSAGQHGVIWCIQDDTGARAVAFRRPTNYSLASENWTSALLGQATPGAISGYAYSVLSANGTMVVRLGVIPTRVISPWCSLNALTVMPSAAWSVNERLFTSYSGPLFRVRRASDSLEVDIFSVITSGLCDQAAIASHCGASLGYVTKLYDQSGGSRDLAQTTSTAQPTIYTGAAVVKSGANVAMSFDGTTDVLTRSSETCGISGNGAFTLAYLYAPASTGLLVALSFGSSGGRLMGAVSDLGPRVYAASGGATKFFNAAASGYRHDWLFHTASSNISTCTCRVNTTAIGTAAGGTNGNFAVSTSGVTSMGATLGSGNWLNGLLSTALVWPSVVAGADLTLTETLFEQRRTAV